MEDIRNLERYPALNEEAIRPVLRSIDDGKPFLEINRDHTIKVKFDFEAFDRYVAGDHTVKYCERLSSSEETSENGIDGHYR